MAAVAAAAGHNAWLPAATAGSACLPERGSGGGLTLSTPVAAEEIVAGFEFGGGNSEYEIGDLLGQGSFAKVYKCRCVKSDAMLAVKVVGLQRLKFLPDFEEQNKMLTREVEILRTLRHERIVNMHDFCTTDEHWFLVMELVCHGELFHNIPPNRGMRELEAKYVFWQLLEGIGYIHSKGVIHRDLKPENILIVRSTPAPASSGAPGQRLHDVKIADFGLSKVRAGDFSPARSCVGSPVYAAPEIFSQKGYDEAVDAWSLGAILYVMLCGQYPFDGRTLPKDILLGTVAQVSARVSPKSVDMIELHARSGEVRAYGSSEAPLVGPFVLQFGERIIGVGQEEGDTRSSGSHSNLGNCLAFYTSAGRILDFSSPSAASYNRFAAAAGQQIVGLGFEGSRLVAIKTAPARNAAGALAGLVAMILGWSGSALDGVEFRLRDGTSENYGGDGGSAKGPWSLAPDELILSVSQEHADQYLSNSIAFFTSAGRTIAVEGSGARRKARFAVPHDRQIDRLVFERSGRLCGVADVPESAQVCCASFKMDSAVWPRVSEDAQRIVYGLLRVDPLARLKLEACLSQPWLRDPNLPELEQDFIAFIKRGSKGELISRAAQDAARAQAPPQGTLDPRADHGAAADASEAQPEETELAALPGRNSDSVYGAVMQIRGRVCSAVDRVELHLWKGHAHCYGGHGGGPVGPWKLKPNEFIVGVEQEVRDTDLGYLGNEMAFFTSKGSVITLTGSYARRVHRFAVPHGHQVVGLCLEGPRLTGVRGRPARNEHGEPEGAVARIGGRLGDCLDQVRLELRNGSVEVYGGSGGTESPTFHLHPQELIVAVSQEHYDQYLGCSIAFFTSMGNVHAIDGRKAGHKRRFSAPSGSQIFGLHFQGSKLVEALAKKHADRPRGASRANIV